MIAKVKRTFGVGITEYRVIVEMADMILIAAEPHFGDLYCFDDDESGKRMAEELARRLNLQLKGIENEPC